MVVVHMVVVVQCHMVGCMAIHMVAVDSMAVVDSMVMKRNRAWAPRIGSRAATVQKIGDTTSGVACTATNITKATIHVTSTEIRGEGPRIASEWDRQVMGVALARHRHTATIMTYLVVTAVAAMAGAV